MDKINSKMSSFELDQLKEVINIGASYASTALSQLINKKVMITVPEAIIDSFTNISKMMGENQEQVSAVIMKVLGDAPGVMAYLFPHGCDGQLAALVTGKERSSTEQLNEFEMSALREVGNILAGASLSALSKFLNLTLVQSVSETVQDSLSAVFNTILAEITKNADEVLIFKISFIIDGEDIKSQLTLFVDPSTTEKILKLTGQKIS